MKKTITVNLLTATIMPDATGYHIADAGGQYLGYINYTHVVINRMSNSPMADIIEVITQCNTEMHSEGLSLG